MTGTQTLAERIRGALAAHAPVREVRMFGGLAFMVDERMLVCARGDSDLLVRSDPARAAELLALPGARPAEMGAGGSMGHGWISVAQDALEDDEDLARWLGVALEHHRAGRNRGDPAPGGG
ncbi:TfoX/Sxy family protein [Actinotalea sp. JY-7885]|uniref:TfoX/Sxy family protein n=1 Tax=Actinotalea sp. JY-7885 TaxID=2758576 RepID=UPI00165E6DC7|nr:TfoX/Sxy family protein [Actinotalea sp. JY-7885]